MKKCLDKDPQKRYTFEEIVTKLTELQQTEDSILKEQHYTKIQVLNPVITEPESQVESKIVADLKKNEVIDTKLEDKTELTVNGNENWQQGSLRFIQHLDCRISSKVHGANG